MNKSLSVEEQPQTASQITKFGKDVTRLFATVTNEHLSHLLGSEAVASLQEKAQRFDLWANSLGLHRQDHASLTYRLRDAPVVADYTVDVLKDLKEVLETAEEDLDFISHQQGDREPDEPPENLEDFSDDEVENAMSFNTEDVVEIVLNDVERCLKRLFRLAFKIRDPRLRHGFTRAKAYQEIDTDTGLDLMHQFYEFERNHIIEIFASERKCPVHDCSESFLITRLAKANVLRRKQFKHWKRHHLKLQVHNQSTSVVQSRECWRTNEREMGLFAKGRMVPTISNPTTATRLNPELLNLDDDRSTVVSTYSTTAFNQSDDCVKLEIPEPPNVSGESKEFECQYCFTLCPVKLLKPHIWRDHVFRDLKPYVCTYENCHEEDQLYDSYQEWRNHEATHCADPQEEARPCPICGKEQVSKAHIASELQRIAVFALPKGANDRDESTDRLSGTGDAILRLSSEGSLTSTALTFKSNPHDYDSKDSAEDLRLSSEPNEEAERSTESRLASQTASSALFLDEFDLPNAYPEQPREIEGRGELKSSEDALERQSSDGSTSESLLLPVMVVDANGMSTEKNQIDELNRPNKQKEKRVFCTYCDRYPGGFRDACELQRHFDAQHATAKKVWICVDGSPNQDKLKDCKWCMSQKTYPAYYNAAAHLRRIHFKPEPEGGKKGKTKWAERGRGTYPPMEELKKYWMKQVELRDGEVIDVNEQLDLETIEDEETSKTTSTDLSEPDQAKVLGFQGKYNESEKPVHTRSTEIEGTPGHERLDASASNSGLARALSLQRKHEESEELLRRVFEKREKTFGNDNATVASASDLAMELNHQGKYKEAEEMLRQILREREKTLGSDHLTTLASTNDLAKVLYNQGEWEEAEELGRRAVEGREKMLGRDHPDTLASISGLAWVLNVEGKWEEATKLLRQALESREKTLGREDPNTFTTVSDLATILVHQGKFNEAEALHHRALNLKEKILGPEHPDTLDTFAHLGHVYLLQGRSMEAEVMCVRARKGMKKVLGLLHPKTLKVMRDLGSICREQDRLFEAEWIYLQALEGMKKALGLVHPTTLDTMASLGYVHRKQGKLADAEEIYSQALEGMAKTRGTAHPKTLDTMASLGYVYRKQGKLVEAEETYARALEGMKKTRGLEHYLTQDTMARLGNIYHKQGKLAEAEKLYLQTLDRMKQTLGLEHWSTLRTMNDLGQVYFKQDKFAEAEETYLQALEGMKMTIGLERSETLGTMAELGLLYREQGKLAEAEELYLQLLERKRKIWGPEDPKTLDTMYDLGCVYEKQGKMAAAVAMFLQAVEGCEKTGTPSSWAPHTARKLGKIYDRQGWFTKATDLFTRALRGFEKIVEPEDADLLSTVQDLGDCYLQQSMHIEAQAMYERSLNGFERIWGPEDGHTLNAVTKVGYALSGQDRFTEAMDMYTRALKGYEKTLKPEDETLLFAIENVGDCYYAQGIYTEAEAMWTRFLNGVERVWGPEDFYTIFKVHKLGHIYHKQGKLAEAERIYVRVIEGFTKKYGSEDSRTLRYSEELREIREEMQK